MDIATDTLLLGLAWYVAFLFSLTVHEASHAWAALRLGDPTAYEGGQVTLNPAPHMQRAPVGTVLIPLLTFALSGFMMGWASAPYDPRWAYRHPKRSALMALAGPVSNLLIALAAGIAIRVSLAAGWLSLPSEFTFSSLVVGADGSTTSGPAAVLSILFSLNVLLFLFNLLPVPPLDGSAVLQLVMGSETARRYQEFMAQPMLALMGILVAWRVFGEVFGPVYWFFVKVMLGGVF